MIALVLRIALDPRVAGYAAAAVLGAPELGPVLERVCERESGCKAIGVHACDAHRSVAAWVDATRRMRVLDQDRCAWHRLEAGPWATSGPWGAMRAYTLHHLQWCAPVWALDVPILGALAVVRRMSSTRCRRVHGCARWMGAVARSGESA